jgi:ABC-2 type transport system ATP-binding protein
MNTVIEVKKLYKKYKNGTEAVKEIDFVVKKGEVFAFLGPNGAGKTTTVEILEGLRNKTSGEIYYFGEKIENVGQKIKEKIGVVLQKTELMELLTVKETIKLFSSFYKKSVPYKEIIETINLKEKENSRVKGLSGGQNQRLAIGLALVNDPEIVFLDEPTTGLDPQARRKVWELIKELKSKGKTVFLTTHYMEEAENLADHVCIMDHGKIIAEGSVEELINKMSEDKSIIEFQMKNSDEALTPPVSYRKSGDTFIVKTDNVTKTLSEIMNWAKNQNIKLKKIDIHNPNLEDLFIQLTGKELRD